MILDRILVTGGAGFIGSHLVEKLSSLGEEVLALDNLSNGSWSNIAHVQALHVKGDVSEYLTNTIGHIDCIYHLACHPRSLSFKNPFRDIEVNLLGTVNVLTYARRQNCKVIFTSNSGIYGESEEGPITEQSVDKPSSPYDIDKLASEHYMQLYNSVYKVPVTIFRLATVYGSRQRVTEGWRPVVAEFVTKMLKGITPTIYGNGFQTRDFIHVSDVVNALVKAKDVITDSKPILLATENSISILDLYSEVAKLIGFDKSPHYEPKRLVDVMGMNYRIGRAKTQLNWRAAMGMTRSLEIDVIPYYTSRGWHNVS